MTNLITPPDGEVVTLDEARSQCRIDQSDEDALLQSYIQASGQHIEDVTGRQRLTATWELSLDGFSCWIDVPKPPLRSVTSITYVDQAGVTQTWAASNYKVLGAVGANPSPTARRGRIELAYGAFWPITRWESGSVMVRFSAGYGDASKVPTALKQAQLMLISHWYRNREPVNIGNITSTLPMAVDALLGPYRTWALSGH